MKGLLKSFKNIGLGIVATALMSTSAHAVNLDFGFSGFSFIFDRVAGQDLVFGAYGDNRSSSSLVYDELAQTVNISIAGIGTINNDDGVRAEVNEAAYTYNLAVSGVTEDANGNLVVNNLGTNAQATYSFDQVADIGSVAGTVQITAFEQLSAELIILDNVIGEGLNSDGWFDGIGQVLVNGGISNIFNYTGGDYDLNFGVEGATGPTTEVPEPATALLLGFGAIGGALKRRKATA